MGEKEGIESENPKGSDLQNIDVTEHVHKQEGTASYEESDFTFLQEKIKERPINKKKLLQRMVITASLALLFGALACLTFLLLEPVLNNWLYPEEEPGIVTFPQEKNEMLPEDMLTEGNTTSQNAEENEEAENTIGNSVINTDQAGDKQTDINNNGEEHTNVSGVHQGSTQLSSVDRQDNTEASVEDAEEEESEYIPLKGYQAQYEELYNAYTSVATSMVTVTALHSDVDWFNNPYQSEGMAAGVIIANNNRELLILTKKEPLDDAEDIRITFCNDTNATAQIKQFDANTNLAVLAVDLKYLGASTLDYISVAVLGSSVYSGLIGAPVIAVGNLFGYKDNVCYGIVTSKGNIVSLADSEYKLITTDIYASESPSGILVNLQGEVIGIIDNTYNHDDTGNLLSAIGITELKGIIAKLSNGDDIPYLGIYAQDIPAEAKLELGLPQGAYIFDIDMDSPAMQKGIQRGDILVQLSTQEIRSALDYMNALRGISLEQTIEVTVRRASVDAYEEMQFIIQPTLQPES